ncbi:MAG: efflux RND transporter periplasmic adaptor subunit [Humidesulfovibrio sp.]|nr:efflux RND transporter periplasmic adaptor subunit [Humidesulfovibrio sp.]
MRIRTRYTLPLMFAALFAVLPGCGQNQQAGGPPQGGAPEVTVVTIAPQSVTLTDVLPGRTSAHLMADVRPQVGGIVQKRLFREGSDVKAGETLYQIDPSTYQASYDNAKATLAKAEANALPARLKAERYANLVKVNGVSKQDNDDAQAANGQAEAEVQAAKAALESAHINLSYTRVTSPIAGRIGKSTVTPGALVTASQATALATVQQTDPIYVDVTQSSAEVLRLKRDLASGKLKKAGADGAKVKLLFEDGSAYASEGVLQFSDITVDQNTGVITLRALFPNPNHELLPGLYVRAVLEEGIAEQAILVPQAAVARDSKGDAQVLVVKADGTVELRPVTVDRVVGDKWLVSSGLAAGDKVVVEGLQKVKPGGKAKAVEAAAPAAAQPEQANATSQSASTETGKAPAGPAATPTQAAKPKPESTNPETAKPQIEKPRPGKVKAEKASADKEKTVTASADKAQVGKTETAAERTPAKKHEPLVYSPPKNEPWPTSTLNDAPAEKSGQTPEHTPAQQ